MRRFRLSPRAQQDLDDIYDYTFSAWGERQADKYLAAFDERFLRLAENPHMGPARNEVREGFRSFPQGRHVIFYMIEEGGIVIVGVPHGGMDIEAYFQRTD